MNKDRRRQLVACIQKINAVVSELEYLRDQEEDALGNMPENLLSSDRCEAMEAAIDNMTDALSCLAQAQECLEDID